ncbi:hypothetical protein ACX0G9_21560 [Flavitalea flava]
MNKIREVDQEEKAPLFKRWSTWYALVIGFLIVLVGFFFYLTKHFS